MDTNYMLKIIQLCCEIDTVARDAYKNLSVIADSKEMKDFWDRMSKQEASHVEFWKQALKEANEVCFPKIFEYPVEVIRELHGILHKSKLLSDKCVISKSIPDSFLLSYRLEFYLLSPVFHRLFDVLSGLIDMPNPADSYESHLGCFVSMFVKYKKLTPSLELLAETLQGIWKDVKVLSTSASTDSLTGLLNRKTFTEISEYLAYLSKRKGSVVGMLMLDIDNFKNFNDKYGHQMGDKVLRTVAGTMKKSLRESDIIGRYGGEEFVIFMPETSLKASKEAVERLRKAISHATVSNHNVTCSIGMCIGKIESDPIPKINSMISKADDALYLAKSAGRNCTKIAVC